MENEKDDQMNMISCEEAGGHMISEIDVGAKKCLFCDYEDPLGRKGFIAIEEKK